MKIDVDQTGSLRLQEVYTGVTMETREGNQIGVCMRDDTLEINVCPGGVSTGNWWRVDMQSGRIESMAESHEPNASPRIPDDCSQFRAWLRHQDLWVRIAAHSKTVYQAMYLAYTAAEVEPRTDASVSSSGDELLLGCLTERK